MYEVGTQNKVITDEVHRRQLKGAIHLLIRVFPLLLEDKELLMRAMWREQALFGN